MLMRNKWDENKEAYAQPRFSQVWKKKVKMHILQAIKEKGTLCREEQ